MNKHITKLIKETDDSELRRLLLALIEALTGESDISRRIEKLLDCAIAFYDSDRAYVIEGDKELVTGINTCERCAPGVVSQRDTLKDMPSDVFRHWLEIFNRFEEVAIPDMETIKDSRPSEYKYFNDSDVHSIIVVPFSKRINQGFVGVDNPKKHKTDTMPLRILSYAVVLELNEIKLTREKDALIQVSQYSENFVQVHLLGALKVSARGGTLQQDKFSIQSHALLAVMLLNPGKIFSPNELYEVLSQDKESDNPANVVASAIYRLRSTLDIIGLKDLISCGRSTYSLDQRFRVETDAERFKRFYLAMKNAATQEEKIQQCHNALQLFHGPLPEYVCSSVRWIMECSDMNAKFLGVAREAVRLHLERGNYGTAYDIVQYALKVGTVK